MSFAEVLQAYRATWNRGDAKALVSFFSPDFRGSYAHTLDEVETSTPESTEQGWAEAFDQFRHRPFRFDFEDIAITPEGENGMLVVGWLRLLIDGRNVGDSFRMEVWREEQGTWRLLRDHQEYSVRR